VIDADLGLSGASAAQRGGFKELVGRVSLSEVGLILSSDVTRLARNYSDWYPLLDICGMRSCLIADRDGVFDPGSANGRLLLGLKGTISELELHTIRGRLTAGLLAKPNVASSLSPYRSVSSAIPAAWSSRIPTWRCRSGSGLCSRCSRSSAP
jgi:DNA invertase Pin-like site-specific DNA recombinase